MIKTLLLVGAGGFFGSISRYLITRFVDSHFQNAFPLGTFAVNITGCFIIGLLMGLYFNNVVSSRAQLFLATGFCGGFTTFSTYALEFFELYQKGQPGLSLAYAGISITAGFLFIGLGFWAAGFAKN